MRNRENVAPRVGSRFEEVEMKRRFRATVVVLALLVALGGADFAAAIGKHYPSPEEATKAFMAALRAGDIKALLEILGTEADEVVDSGDPVADRNAREKFAALYDEANKIVNEGDAKAVLEVGKDEWPFPIPLVKEEGGWRFDTDAGEEEILNRRIGRNELSAVEVSLAFVDAQREYYTRNPDKSKLLHYASHFLSTQGKRDGLYWPTGEAEEPSPLGPLVAEARAEGYKKDKTGERTPYHGYFYKILTAQGPDAAGGAYDYIVHGQLIGGFALVAYPADYGASGVMTFLVNHDGVVFEKDLGPDTAVTAEKMTSFNPDSTWTKVKADEPGA
jgi:hypothetical protein